jgi:ADP-heptose:LPS heptosyltransferase
MPLAVKAKQLWPDAKLTWVVDCGAASLLDGHAAVDEVLTIDKRWLKSPGRWKSLRSELQSRAFDLVLDPQGLSKSSLLGCLSGATHRVGFDYSQAREVAPLLATRRIRRTARHMVDCYLQLLSPWCTLTPGSGEFKMPVYKDAISSAEQIQAHLSLKSWESDRWVAINAGAGWPSKQWPPERFGRIAFEIQQKFKVPSLVIWGGNYERALAEQIAEHSGGAAVVAPETNLRELVELIRRAYLLISSDTAALQIASAVNTQCVGLFGPTWADEVGPYGNRHIAIQSTVLPDRSKGMRRASHSSMNAIEISEVLRACSQLLGSQALGSRPSAIAA